MSVQDRIVRGVGTATCAAVAVFMAGPAIAITVMSFASGKQLAFPPHGWGFDQYRSFATGGVWLPAIRDSVVLALPVSAIAVVIGVLAALALQRTELPLRGLFRAVGLAPLIVPGVAYAVALYAALSRFQLVGTFWGLALADCMLVIPLVIVIVEAALMRLPKDLELAAMSLGASRWRAMNGITLRLLQPAIIAAFVLAFIANFDESVFVNFLAGSNLTTLPKGVFESLRTGLDPSIAAVATSLMVVTTGLVVVAYVLRRATPEPLSIDEGAAEWQ
jgi:ABC-type spermidine/putrescine transport system permease subunit II